MAAGGWDGRVIANKKVFRNGKYLIGYTTSFRMGQLLQYAVLPEYPDTWTKDRETTLRFIVTEFVPAVRKIFKDEGFAKIESNQEEAGQFLVGYHGFLFHIYESYQVDQYTNGICATGSGYAYGLGAFEIMMGLYPSEPESNLLKALEVAGEYNNGVCAPYYVLECPA